MVAKITFPKRLEAALNYNENKVAQQKASILHASGFLKEASQMNFYEKLGGFERLNELNERATTKTIHISLNFDPSEKLSNQKLIDIANTYMERIGFGEQPFLVYSHGDAGHPHIHIVSNTIREDGSRINTHNIGRNSSEKARKEIEQAFALVKAQKGMREVNPTIKPIDPEKAVYGKSETKRAISNVVTAVFNQYKFASLPEYNAILRQFGVMADRGKEDGRIYNNEGLLYRLLDEQGNKIGVPIKASTITCRPTLKNLVAKFENKEAKEPFKEHTRVAIDKQLREAQSIQELIALLAKQNVYTVLRQNANGQLYGITFVDNKSKCVFNGSDLGKGYSATGLQRGIANQPFEKEVTTPNNDSNTLNGSNNSSKKMDSIHQLQKLDYPAQKSDSILDTVLSVKEQLDGVPSSLLQKKRKKKNRKNNHL